jgi:hypothetical protein
MPTPTYTALATITLGSAAASITFGSIPANYRDLVISVSGSLAANGHPSYRFNADTGSNYSHIMAQGGAGYGTFSASRTGTNLGMYEPQNLDANVVFNFSLNLMDYSATDKHKSGLMRINGVVGGSGVVAMTAGRWANTAAVTSVTVLATQNYNIGTTFSLYGVIA